MVSKIKIALIAGVMAVGFASPALAVTMKAVYSGIVINGNDPDEIFGQTDNLEGAPYVATFTYDTDIERQSSPVFDQVYGGLPFVTPSPMLSADILINGITFNFDVSEYGQATTYNDGTVSYIYHAAEGPARIPRIFLYEYRDDVSIPRDLTATFSVLGDGLFAPGFSQQGYFDFEVGDGELLINSVKVSQLSAVPLPAGLPLLATGLAVLGAARRRKAKRVAA
jgi:hypothetical protein